MAQCSTEDQECPVCFMMQAPVSEDGSRHSWPYIVFQPERAAAPAQRLYAEGCTFTCVELCRNRLCLECCSATKRLARTTCPDTGPQLRRAVTRMIRKAYRRHVVVVPAITVTWLEKHLACQDQVDRFRKVFGERAELTRANLDKAIAEELDLHWLAEYLLTEWARKRYRARRHPAIQAYLSAESAAMAKYVAIVEPAAAEYRQAMTLARQTHDAYAAELEAKREAGTITQDEYTESVQQAAIALDAAWGPAYRKLQEIANRAEMERDISLAPPVVTIVSPARRCSPRFSTWTNPWRFS